MSLSFGTSAAKESSKESGVAFRLCGGDKGFTLDLTNLLKKV